MMAEDSASTDVAKMSISTPHSRRVNGQVLPSYLHVVLEGGPLNIFCGELRGTLLCDKFRCPGINAECILSADGELMTPKKFMEAGNKEKLKDWKNAIRLDGTNEQIRKAFGEGRLDFFHHDASCSGKCRARATNTIPSNGSLVQSLLPSLGEESPPPQEIVVSSIGEHTYSFLPDDGERLPRRVPVGAEILSEGILRNIKVDPDSDPPPAWHPPTPSLQVSTQPAAPAAGVPQENGIMGGEVMDGEGSPQDVVVKWRQVVECNLLPDVQKMLNARIRALMQLPLRKEALLKESKCLDQVAELLGCSEAVVEMLAEKKRQRDHFFNQKEMELKALEENYLRKQREVIELQRGQQELDKVIQSSSKLKRKVSDIHSCSSSSDTNSSNESPQVKGCPSPKKPRHALLVKTQALLAGKGKKIAVTPKSAKIFQPSPSSTSGGGPNLLVKGCAQTKPVCNSATSGLVQQPSLDANSAPDSSTASQVTGTSDVPTMPEGSTEALFEGLLLMAVTASQYQPFATDEASVSAEGVTDLPIPGDHGARKAAVSSGSSLSQDSPSPCSSAHPEVPTHGSRVCEVVRGLKEDAQRIRARKSSSEGQPKPDGTSPTTGADSASGETTAEESLASKATADSAACVEEEQSARPDAPYALPIPVEKPATPRRNVSSPTKGKSVEKSMDAGKSPEESDAPVTCKIKSDTSSLKSRHPSPRKCTLPAPAVTMPEGPKVVKDKSPCQPAGRRVLGRTEETKSSDAKAFIRRSARRISQPNKYNDFETH